jgi:hypothetical protein
VGMAFSLTPDDHIFGSHRSHGEILAKGFSAIRQLGERQLLEIMRAYRDGAVLARWSGDTSGSVQRPGRAVLRLRRLQRDLRPRDRLQPRAGRLDARLLHALWHLPQQRHRRRLRIDRPRSGALQAGEPEARHRGGQHRRRLLRLRPGVGGHHLREHGPVPQALGSVAGRRSADHLQLHGQLLRNGRPAQRRDHGPASSSLGFGAGVNPEQMHAERRSTATTRWR